MMYNTSLDNINEIPIKTNANKVNKNVFMI